MSRSRISARHMLISITLIAAVTGIGYWLQDRSPGEQTVFQGYVEGDLLYLAPETGGRIVTLDLSEGDRAAAEQRAFMLDDRAEVAQRDEAEARLNQAKALLIDLRAAQQRPEQIAVLRAQEDQAKAQLELARVELERQKTLLQRGFTSKALADQAQTAFDQNTAALTAVRRQITAAELAGRLAVINAGEAAVKAASASLVKADTVLDNRTIKVPRDAIVQDIFFRTGEVVNAGQPVLSLLPPGNLKYRFYVPETVFSKFRIGKKVAISCDVCPPGLMASVSFISSSTEFTPPVIFSDEERAKLVFKVEAIPLAPVDLPLGLPVKVHSDGQTEGKASHG